MNDIKKVDFDNVYQIVAELRNCLENDVISKASIQYQEIKSMLEEEDSGTNARLIEAMATNQEKTETVAQALLKLLLLIENATKAVQQEDQKIAKQLQA